MAQHNKLEGSSRNRHESDGERARCFYKEKRRREHGPTADCSANSKKPEEGYVKEVAVVKYVAHLAGN